MRVLLDECLPRKLKRDLQGHRVRTVPEMGWASVKNGPLLRLAAEQFDVFITIDKNLNYQQNLERTRIAIVVLVAPSNRLADLRPLMAEVRDLLPSIRPGQMVKTGG